DGTNATDQHARPAKPGRPAAAARPARSAGRQPASRPRVRGRAAAMSGARFQYASVEMSGPVERRTPGYGWVVHEKQMSDTLRESDICGYRINMPARILRQILRDAR